MRRTKRTEFAPHADVAAALKKVWPTAKVYVEKMKLGPDEYYTQLSVREDSVAIFATAEVHQQVNCCGICVMSYPEVEADAIVRAHKMLLMVVEDWARSRYSYIIHTNNTWNKQLIAALVARGWKRLALFNNGNTGRDVYIVGKRL